MMAEVISEVVAEPRSRIELHDERGLKDLPPISAVLTFPPLITSKVAVAMLLAIESSLVQC